MQEKKILIFLGSLTSGGAERVTTVLSKYLVRETNFSVVVVTLDGTNRDFYSLDPQVKRIAMDLAKETKGASKYFTNIKRVISFRKVVVEENPDIILAMMTRYAVIALIATFLLNVKVIVSERNYPGKRENHRMWEFLREYTYRYADLHVVQTQKIAEWLKVNTQSRNFMIVPNSISWPLPEYEPILMPEDFFDENDKIILGVGSLKEQKGFDLLLNAAADFLHKYPEWNLVIVGEEKDEDGSRGLKEKFKEVIKINRLTDQILMPGRVGNIGAWYERADIFVLSSRYEGFPNVLLEAMASGCACVSFDCDTGPSDMIESYKNGILVPDGNVEAMRNTIQYLMDNPHQRDEFGAKALKMKTKYSEENILKKWGNAFKRLL